MKQKTCEQCGSTFTKTESSNPHMRFVYERRWLERRYCTPICARQAGLKRSWAENHDNRVEALKAPWRDPRRVAEMKDKMPALFSGSKSPYWKGENATYNSKHRYIQNHWKRTGKCDSCKTIPPPRKNGHSGTEWANISGQYLRDRSDWYELCSKCHKFFDKAKRLGLR